jgi:putative DNA primase/helicase
MENTKAGPDERPGPERTSPSLSVTPVGNSDQAPFASAVDIYRHGGWEGTLWTPKGEKWPPPTGFTGYDGRFPTADDVAFWRRESGANIALRVPHGVMGLDVDAYLTDKEVKTGDKTLAALVARFGPLPPTWRSTSRNDPATGISFYRVPTGVKFPGDAGDYIEIIQFHHRYALVWPSVVDLRQYRWYRPDGTLADEGEAPSVDDLPQLPEAWIIGLQALDDDEVAPKPRDQMRQGDGRNNSLTRLAGSARRQGASQESIEALLKSEAKRMIDPLPDDEVKQIAKSIARYDPAPLLAELHCTDLDNGRWFATLFGDRARWDHRRGQWLIWDTVRWRPDADGEIARLAREALRRMREAAEALSDDALRSKWIKHSLASESLTRREAMLTVAKAEKPIADRGDAWDTDPWLLGVPNGVVDLRTGKLRDAVHPDRITKQAGVPYDPQAKAPRWRAFVSEVMDNKADRISFLRRALGYSMSGDCREEVVFFAFGSGANGKSKLFEAVGYALGDYQMDTPLSTFTTSRHGESGATNDLAALPGARFVTVAEPADGSTFNAERIKKVSGRDLVTARFLHREFFSYRPVAKLWLFGNHKPRVSDRSAGFWRRMRLIPFGVSFEGDPRKDPLLAEKLRAEAPGILAWLVEACMEWQREGLAAPPDVLTATEGYRDETDDLRDFLDAKCIELPSAWTSKSEMWDAYKAWCADQGTKPYGRNTFLGKVGDRYEPATVNGARGFKGIGLPASEHSADGLNGAFESQSVGELSVEELARAY